jgi:hypothetical protein
MFSLILENRKLFNLVFLNNKVSSKITSKIWLISRLSIKKRIFFFNNQLWVVMLSSNLVVSRMDLLFLLKYKLIYLNYNIVTNGLTLKCNDIINLVYNKNYFKYLLFRSLNCTTFTRKFKKKHLNINNFFLKNFLINKEFKKNNVKIFKYLFFFKNLRLDNIEIDYSILSILILNSYIEFNLNFIL